MSTSAIIPGELLAHPDDDLQMYTPAEAAHLLKTTTGTLSQLRFRGQGPRVTMLGCSVRYRRCDLLTYIKDSNYDPSQGVPKHIKRRKPGPGRPPNKKQRRAGKGA